MKTQRIQLLPLWIMSGFLMTGCSSPERAWLRQPATSAYRGGEIMVIEKQPQPRREIIGTPPDDAHVWVEGYWMHSNRSWIWIPGHWEALPRPGAA
jgi:hypothetical protein